MRNRSEIVLKNIQIKSIEKACKVAKALTVLEEETGIKETKITLDNVFWCPWIDNDKLNKTPMEKILVEIIDKIKIQ